MPKALSVDKETLKCLYVSGLSLAEISRRSHVNQNSLSTMCKRGGWAALRSRARQELNEPLQKLAGVTAAELSALVRQMLAEEVHEQVAALRGSPVETRELANTPQRQGRAAIAKSIADTATTVFDWDHQPGQSIITVGELVGTAPEDLLMLEVAEERAQISDAQPRVEKEALSDLSSNITAPENFGLDVNNVEAAAPVKQIETGPATPINLQKNQSG